MARWKFPKAVERVFSRFLDDPDKPPVVELRTREGSVKRKKIGVLEARKRLPIDETPAYGFVFDRDQFERATVINGFAHIPVPVEDFHIGLRHIEEHDPTSEANFTPRQARKAERKAAKAAEEDLEARVIALEAELEHKDRLLNLHLGYTADASAIGFTWGATAPTRVDTMARVPIGPDWSSIYLTHDEEQPVLRIDLIEANHTRTIELRAAITEVQRKMLQAMENERVEVRWLACVNDFADPWCAAPREEIKKREWNILRTCSLTNCEVKPAE